MKVSVVIVSYKVPYHLMLCLGSLKKALQNIDAEIIVIDNASNDNAQELVKQFYPRVKYIQNSSNDGFSKANNIAIKQAKGEYICLLNPDTAVSETSIVSALTKHQKIKKCGILGIRLVDGTGQFLPESKINKLTLKVAALKMLGFSKSFYNNNIPETSEGETDTLVGAFMCFKKQDYERLEGLDEQYFMYGEDIDLSFQFTKAGFQNYYLGSENLLHFKGESTIRDEVYFNRFFESVKLFFTKHYTNSKFMIAVLSLFFVIAKRFKKSAMKDDDRSSLNPKNIVLIGDNLELKLKLESYFNKNISSLGLQETKDIEFENSLIIFNANQIEYHRIISLMIKHNNAQNIFRIIPEHLQYLIGSDSSTSQGKVISFA